MKKILYILGIVICIITLLVFIAIGSGAMKLTVPLKIPSLNISTNCEYVFSYSNLQKVVDKENTAAWWDVKYIGDHAGQNFNGLWNIKIGDTVVFGDVNYYCAFITTGFTENGLQPKPNESIPDADLYLMTCVPGGDNFEVYIIGLNRVLNRKNG